ncbi:MAG: hypothetical protein EBS83_13710, partial [Planctomycetia bacterium]|nr:hypothetical protein [Planctomycetia bacterium]
ERVNKTDSWRRLVLYRIVPPADMEADSPEESPPLTVTFALTGLGEARIDAVAIRPLSRGASGASVRPAATATGGFPRPDDLLRQAPAMSAAGPKAPPPAPTTSEPEATWPGMDLSWPKLLPFTRPDNAPPPGPSGSTIDPFKRARGGASAAGTP